VTESRQYDHNRIDFDIAGRPGFLIDPANAHDSGSRPWIWYAPSFVSPRYLPGDRQAWLFSRLLGKGFHIAGVDVGESYGNPEGRRIFHELYTVLTFDHGLSPKASLLPQSRGGLMHYNWAAEHPECVACIGGIYTVCDMSSWPGLEKAAPAYGVSADELARQLPQHNPIDRLAPIAAAKVPIFHIHGDNDVVVPLERNSGELIKRYCELGGPGEVEIIKGFGHEEHDVFFESDRLLQFFLTHAP
jgi:pimeloyl-ACP methyl ester carboxylesterase